MSRIAMALALASLLAAMTARPDRFPQSPQIRVSTRLVEVGVIVRDKNGPIENLTKNDFTVLDRGKPQQVSIFTVNSAVTAQPPVQPLHAPCAGIIWNFHNKHLVSVLPRR